MALDFPWELFMEPNRRTDRNRQAMAQDQQQMVQNIAGIGQGLGQGLGSIGEMIQKKKQQDLVNQLIQMMKTQGVPQQGPQMPGVGTMPQGVAGPSMPPVSGMGAPAQDNSEQMKALLMKLDPKGMMSSMETQMFQPRMNPLQQSEFAHLTSPQEQD